MGHHNNQISHPSTHGHRLGPGRKRCQVRRRTLRLRIPYLANGIRGILYRYIVESFRPRLDIAIYWLTEEWYADKLAAKTDPAFAALPNYSYWSLKILDALLPYFDARDSILLVRFLSEIPAVSEDILDRVQSLARDPERAGMCMMGLQYLILTRPSVRGLAIDAVERIFRDDDFMEAMAQARKVLMKWRPAALEEKKVQESTEPSPNVEEAMAYEANGQVTEAASLREQVVKTREQTLAKDHPDRLASQQSLARAYQAKGHVTEAVSLREQEQ